MSRSAVDTKFTESLIKEVKARPKLYLKGRKHSDAEVKDNLWEEVAGVLFAKVWKKCSVKEKARKVDLVRRKWKNLRACFARELKREKDPKWKYGIGYKRRRYIHYQKLLFLKADFELVENVETPPGIDLPKITGPDTTKIKINKNIEELPTIEALPVPPSKAKTNNTSLLSTTGTIKYDTDSTNFALSLIPMINSLPITKRIDAQVSLLSVLKRYYQKYGSENIK